jgi:outer membrane protein assembly factor BamE
MPDSRRHAVKVQRKMMKKLFMFLLLVTNALMVGCSIHRIDIQQGNVLDDAAVAKVQIGMTKTQVQFLLGTPLIADPFHKDRWDYFFSKRQGEKVLEQRHIALFFENDQLNKIDHDDAQRVLPKKDQ